MKSQAIKVLMAFDDAIPIFQAHGLELRVDRECREYCVRAIRG
jgi:hypothetical protein